MSSESIRLVFKEGNSHKEYNVSLNAVGNDVFTVTFAYGRVGSTLATGSKTPTPVPLSKAQTVYSSLVKSKLKKGYRPDLSGRNAGVISTQSIEAKESIGFRPQLSNPISPDEVRDRLKRGEWFLAQVKMDGERRPIRIEQGEVFAGNRRGERVALRTDMVDQLLKWADDLAITIDTEDCGDFLYVFDVMEIGAADAKPEMRDLRICHANDRRHFMDDLAGARPIPPCLRFAKTIELVSARDLDGLLEATRVAGEEGVILRPASGIYSPGRPNQGGDSLKIKHINSATCIVDGVNEGKRSVKLILRDDHTGQWRFVGSCTIPASASVPAPGSRVEIQYLWSQPNGCLIQPVFKGVRTHEIGVEACSVDQLVIRDPASMRETVG